MTAKEATLMAAEAALGADPPPVPNGWGIYETSRRTLADLRHHGLPCVVLHRVANAGAGTEVIVAAPPWWRACDTTYHTTAEVAVWFARLARRLGGWPQVDALYALGGLAAVSDALRAPGLEPGAL